MYEPSEYWDKIGKVSTPGSGDNSGHFSTDETGTSFYQLPRWTTQPKYWEYMQSNARVLDIGSGNGLQVGRLTQRGVFAVGCDIAFALLKAAKENMAAHGINEPMLVQWDGVRMPFASNTFDRVTTNTVLQHVVDDSTLDSILGETSRILNPGGLFLICELVSPRDVRTAPHVKMRSTQTYRRIAASHSLRITKIRHRASTYIALQSVYSRLLAPAAGLGAVPNSMGQTSPDTSAPRARNSNRVTSLAKRLARRFVSDFAKLADPLAATLHLDHRLAGQDEIVFEKDAK